MSAMESGRDRSSILWPLLYTLFLAALVLSGGISLPSAPVIYFHSGLSLAILAAALVRLVLQGFPNKLSLVGAILACLATALVLAQLIPLPQSLWASLPGRSAILANLDVLQAKPGSAQFSLSPENTRLAGLALLPGLAAYFGALTISHRHLAKCFWALVACAMISAAMAFVQFTQGQGSIFFLYEYAPRQGLGTFNNPSFFAAQIYTAIPMVAALAANLRQKGKYGNAVTAVLAICLIGMLMAGLALSGSRGGIILSMLAIFASVLMAYGSLANLNLRSSAMALGFSLFALLVVAQSSMVGLLRFTGEDKLAGGRLEIFSNSLQLLKEYLPLGSGFGSFMALYQLHETPTTARPEYMNHVHNDWLEVAIEGGIPAMMLELAFLALLVIAVIRVWRYGQGGRNALFQRCASLILPLLALHAMVDFPLRTPAMFTILAFAFGVLVLPPRLDQSPPPSRRKRSGREPEPTQFTRQKVSFAPTERPMNQKVS